MKTLISIWISFRLPRILPQIAVKFRANGNKSHNINLIKLYKYDINIITLKELCIDFETLRN